MHKPLRVCATSDIPEGGSKGFHFSNVAIFAIKKFNVIYLYKNACPHIGIALEWVEDQFLNSSQTLIQCANHGALFVIETGKCVSGPCTGQRLIAIPYEILDKDVFITLA